MEKFYPCISWVSCILKKVNLVLCQIYPKKCARQQDAHSSKKWLLKFENVGKKCDIAVTCLYFKQKICLLMKDIIYKCKRVLVLSKF